MTYWKIKTFLMRFLFSPLIFMWVLLANFQNEEARATIYILILFVALDRFAAWCDRNVPDSDPRKYR